MLIAFSSKAIISDGVGVHKCIRYGQLACFGRHYECSKVYKGFSALVDNAKPHTAAITTALFRRGRVQKPTSGKNGTKFQHQNSRNA